MSSAPLHDLQSDGTHREKNITPKKLSPKKCHQKNVTKKMSPKKCHQKKMSPKKNVTKKKK